LAIMVPPGDPEGKTSGTVKSSSKMGRKKIPRRAGEVLGGAQGRGIGGRCLPAPLVVAVIKDFGSRNCKEISKKHQAVGAAKEKPRASGVHSSQDLGRLVRLSLVGFPMPYRAYPVQGKSLAIGKATVRARASPKARDRRPCLCVPTCAAAGWCNTPGRHLERNRRWGRSRSHANAIMFLLR
jgi:hypothetical protein